MGRCTGPEETEVSGGTPVAAFSLLTGSDFFPSSLLDLRGSSAASRELLSLLASAEGTGLVATVPGPFKIPVCAIGFRPGKTKAIISPKVKRPSNRQPARGTGRDPAKNFCRSGRDKVESFMQIRKLN